MRRRPPDLVEQNRTRNRIADNPGEAPGRFTTVTEWENGAQTRSFARRFSVTTDEPFELGGEDAAMDPMELLLAAMGSCLTIGWAKQAEMRQIVLRKLRVTVEANYDLRGYLALDGNVRPGFQAISYSVDVDSDADKVTIAEIKAAVENTSALFDNILNSTPVHGAVVHHSNRPNTSQRAPRRKEL
jgi:uncharacterized OsmC-like protein